MTTTDTDTTETTDDATKTAEEAPQDTQEAEEGTAPAEPGVDDSQDAQDDDNAKVGAEAAKYRVRAREAEAERDALAQRLTAMQRAEAERLAGQYIANGAALWAAGTDLQDVLDDEGNVSADLVRGAVQDAQAALGLATRSGTPAPDPTQGARGETFGSNRWVQAMDPREAHRR